MNFTEHPKFSLGKIVATPLAIKAMERADNTFEEFLSRHQAADWGDMCPEDQDLNNNALKKTPEQQQRVHSSYKTSNGEVIWIITEWDRSVTTILTPDEY
jgi:hypothetical protein